MERIAERTRDEVAEIERHKYFLSEKMGYDVGWEFAESDWDDNHAAEFRAAQRKAGRKSLPAEPVVADAMAPRGGLRMLFHRMFSRAED